MSRRDEPGGTGLLYGLYQARLRRQLQNATLPHHVAMIIGGNRRWARNRALETTASGHRAGAEKMREFLGWCDDLGIRVVTIYLLSTDNLTGRSSEELDQLFEIIADLADDLSRAADWRIQHVGTTEGLPEPLVEEVAQDPLERAEDVSVAFLLALQRLSPLERAVFLLHDVFDQDYGEVARSLGRTEPACRQLAARARQHVQDARPRFAVSDAEAARLAGAFMQAAASADMTAMTALLTEDAVLISDGGGKRKAALRPMIGRDDVMALLRGLAWRGSGWGAVDGARLVRINGLPGVVLNSDDGPMTMSFEPSDDGRVAAIYIVRNPEKLRGVS